MGKAGNVDGGQHRGAVKLAALHQGVDEVVVSPTVLNDKPGLGHRQPVLGGCLVGVRILARIVNDGGHLDLVPADSPGDVTVDVGGRHHGDPLCRVSGLRGLGTAGTEQEANTREGGKERAGSGWTAHGKPQFTQDGGTTLPAYT